MHDLGDAGTPEAETSGHRSGLAHALQLLDLCAISIEENNGAFGQRALTIFEELGDLVGQANVLNNLGTAAFYQGRWMEALDFYQRAAEVCGRAGDALHKGQPQVNMAEIFIDQGKVAQAEELLEELRTSWGRLPYPFGVGVATFNQGRAALRAGDFERAGAIVRGGTAANSRTWTRCTTCRSAALHARAAPADEGRW